MPNVVITSTVNSIKLEFNDQTKTTENGTWPKRIINGVHKKTDYVEVITTTEGRVQVSNSVNQINALIIDSVDGVQPTSLYDLYQKISALIE